MPFDSDRVRIELCDVITLAGTNMTATQAAQIWPPGGGTITRTRKPAATITADTRPELLRRLADWIEQNDDPGLTKLAAAVAGATAEPDPASQPSPANRT